MKAYGGVDVQIYVFLTSALVGGEWPASRPSRFTLRGKAPGTHWTGGWVGPRNGWNDVENDKFCPYQDSDSDPSDVQPVASRYPGSDSYSYHFIPAERAGDTHWVWGWVALQSRHVNVDIYNNCSLGSPDIPTSFSSWEQLIWP
jgi:hypothetical protein